MKCDYCGEEIRGSEYSYETGGNKKIKTESFPLPFACRRCGGNFCSKHRLPELHDCILMDKRPSSGNSASIESIYIQMNDIDPAVLEEQERKQQALDSELKIRNKSHVSFLCRIGFHRYGKKKFNGYDPIKRRRKYIKICKNCGAEKESFKKGL